MALRSLVMLSFSPWPRFTFGLVGLPMRLFWTSGGIVAPTQGQGYMRLQAIKEVFAR